MGEARVARVYESRTNRALVHNYFIARKYCVLSRYVANNCINVFPANTFFNDAYQTISDIQFIATGRVAPVTGYKYIYSILHILTIVFPGSRVWPILPLFYPILLCSTALKMCLFCSKFCSIFKGSLDNRLVCPNEEFKRDKTAQQQLAKVVIR